MKILWIVNTIFPYPSKQLKMEATVYGGWLNGLADNLNKNVVLAIVNIYPGKEFLEMDDGKIKYFLLPCKDITKCNNTLDKYWKQVIDIFKPDLVHLHGTEFSHGLSFINYNLSKIPVITSIQGLVYRCSDVYLGNIDAKIIRKNITFRDIIKQDNLFQQKKMFEQRGIIEKEIIKKSNAIIGRTTWDYSNVKAINQKVKYYIGNETLRENFYNGEWNIGDVEKYSIFISQATYPIKGVHYLLEAIRILKNKYPNVKLYIGGNNIIDTSTFIKKIKLTGYGRYIKNLIKEYQLNENVIFTGLLNEKQIKEKLLKSHVFVLPSAIENSSNSLGEAMLLGIPCVASNTGGTMDILEHKKEGFLYPYTEPAMCAEYISKFFEDDELAIKIGNEANKKAKERHSPEKNVNEIIKIYKEVIGEEK